MPRPPPQSLENCVRPLGGIIFSNLVKSEIGFTKISFWLFLWEIITFQVICFVLLKLIFFFSILLKLVFGLRSVKIFEFSKGPRPWDGVGRARLGEAVRPGPHDGAEGLGT